MVDPEHIRSQFPSVGRATTLFLDNPGGTQIARHALDRMNSYLLCSNANHGGAFKTSIESDLILAEAHAAMADFLNAGSPDEIVFGPNMTTLTFALSRCLGRLFNKGDEIIVTRLDHDANIAPWLELSQDLDLTIRWADIRPEDVSLNMEGLLGLISERTRLIAFGYASNAVGTINDVATIAAAAREAGAFSFVDAVQAAPHIAIDVKHLDCDFLVCSAYKFFGPHLGVLYGKLDLLRSLPAYKVRPAGNEPPGKFETGTQNHEGIAGTLGAVEYLEWLGREALGSGGSHGPSRRVALGAAMEMIRDYEMKLQQQLVQGLKSIPRVRLWGVTDPDCMASRVPTVSFTLDDWHPRQLAERLADFDIFVWDGNYYALAVMERLGLQERGGMLRVGLVHYNTSSEVDRFLEVLGTIVG